MRGKEIHGKEGEEWRGRGRGGEDREMREGREVDESRNVEAKEE